MDAGQPGAPPRLVQRRTPGLQYFVEHHAGSLLILTNGGAGREFVLMACPLARCERRRAALSSPTRVSATPSSGVLGLKYRDEGKAKF